MEDEGVREGDFGNPVLGGDDGLPCVDPVSYGLVRPRHLFHLLFVGFSQVFGRFSSVYSVNLLSYGLTLCFLRTFSCGIRGRVEESLCPYEQKGVDLVI